MLALRVQRVIVLADSSCVSHRGEGGLPAVRVHCRCPVCFGPLSTPGMALALTLLDWFTAATSISVAVLLTARCKSPTYCLLRICCDLAICKHPPSSNPGHLRWKSFLTCQNRDPTIPAFIASQFGTSAKRFVRIAVASQALVRRQFRKVQHCGTGSPAAPMRA